MNLFRVIADFFFPPVCLVCDKDTEGSPVCETCLSLIQPIEGRFCQRCGQPIERSRRSPVCRECVKHPLALSRIRAWARFSHPLDKIVYAFKYSRRSGLAEFFARRLATLTQSDSLLGQADLLVAVPLHFSKSWWRGYNQSELLAKALSAKIRTPFIDALTRRRITRTQTRLSPEERRKNLQGAFRVKRSIDEAKLKNHRLILLDDVVTSGSTLDEAAKVLLDAGAREVYGLTIGGAWIERS